MSAKISNLQGEDEVTRHVDWEQFECAILESPAKTCLVSRAEGQTLRLEDFRSGLLFGDQAELRFRRRRDGKYHLVYISDSGRRLEGSTPRELVGENGPERIFLWGEALGEDAWYEARIPGKLSYPSAPGWRVAVRVKHYRMDAGGTVHLFRCRGLEPVAKRGEK